MGVEGDAALRSELYRRLADAFRYPDPARTPSLALPERSENVGAAYVAAFDPAASREACSLHESAYGSLEAPSLFEELVRFYAFFGLVRDEGAELPDHVTVELEFMHFLTYLEAKGLQRDDDVGALRRAQHDFLSRHLSRLASGIAESLRSADPHWVALTKLMRQTVDADLESLDPARTPRASAPGTPKVPGPDG